MSGPTKKREAQSPLSGDEEDLKRRIVGNDEPILAALDELSEEDEQSTTDSDLTKLLEQEKEQKPNPDSTIAVKVDSLIGRMDRFMNCFADLHNTVTKNQHLNDRKFKHLESKHNELAAKTASSTSSNRNRIELLETQLKETMSANSSLKSRIMLLEEEQA